MLVIIIMLGWSWSLCWCCTRSCTGGKTEDFQAAARLLHRAGGQVVVPTFLVPATQKVWADVYGQPLPECGGLTAAQVITQHFCGCIYHYRGSYVI